MIGVLLFSRSNQESSWALVRESKRLQVSGMNGSDLVRVLCADGGDRVFDLEIASNCSIPIPDGVTRIKAIHEVASGSDVCVEME